MSNNTNNTLTTTTTFNRNSALFMNELALKSWYSNLHISSAPSKNRISPVAPVPASKSTVQQQQQQQEPSSPSFSHFFRKIARTPTRTLSRSSTMMSHGSWKKKQHQQQHVHIYLKSPHVVASGELAGSIVIQGDTTLVHKMKSIRLDFVGIEAVNDASKTSQKSFSFLHFTVLQLTGAEQVTPYHVSANATEEINKIIVPFLVSLPSDLSGTYIDKKGSIQYYLKSEVQWHADKPTTLQTQAVVIYSNMVLKSLKDATDLYAPVVLSNKQIWKTTKEGHVSIETSMPRSVWMSGAPIYVTVEIHNETLSDTVSDIKLELLRKQNTYSIHHLDQSLVPVTSSCETLATTCLADLGWWKPLEPASRDQVTLTIDTPSNQVTVRKQKLIDVSFSIRLSMQSVLNANTVVSDIPVMLVHPISMDPPPGNYTKSVTTSNTEECHLILQEAATKIATHSAMSVSSTPSLVSSYTESDDTAGSFSEMNVPTRKKFTSMKKSLSKWGLQLSRKISISSGLNSHCGEPDRHANTEKTKLRISSPLISSSVSSSSLHSSLCSKSDGSLQSDQANEEITKIIKNKELQAQQQQLLLLQEETPPEKSIMKFGQIMGPKRFGQQPGCLGDAGLDIRNCFNVATATEAIQCYAAEKVEIPNHDGKEEEGNYYILPPYLEPTQFSELIKKKECVMAPHTEKCQIDPEMMSKSQIQQYEQDHYGSSNQEEEEEEEEETLAELQQDQDQQHQHGNSTKRILASSRHLRNVQRKSVQVSRDGRALLTFSK